MRDLKMPNFKALIIPISVIVLIGAIAFPVFALEYNPGVKAGQYVKYGNFVGTGTGVESFNDYSWSKLEVTAVSGKETTLLSTGQFKDGTAIPGNGTTEIWNIETGTQNGIPSTQGAIIAANLNQGDAIPPSNTYIVNRTENRVYLGVSRSVNILETTVSTPDYSTSLTYVYDRSSGILLESSVETTQNQPQQSTSKYSYSITETNLFGQTPFIGLPLVFVIAVIAIIAVIVIAVGLVLSRRTKYN
jgi:hypothetical protein